MFIDGAPLEVVLTKLTRLSARELKQLLKVTKSMKIASWTVNIFCKISPIKFRS